MQETWNAVKEKLLTAAAKLKKNKVFDIAVEQLLDEIPVVGGFASKYWSTLGGEDAAKALEMARFLEALGNQEATFQRAMVMLQEQGDLLLRSHRSLDLVLLTVSGVDIGVQEIKGDVKRLMVQMDQISSAMNRRFVADALRVSATLVDDHKRRGDLIAVIKKAIADAGGKAGLDELYDLAILFIISNRGELAEACLLELQHEDPDRREAPSALSQLYQRRAHEYILQRNFGFAEDVLDKAAEYAKAVRDDADVDSDVRLGYVFKELGQAYMAASRRLEAAKPLQSARKLFAGVNAVAPDNVSAWNGLGSVDIVEGNYAEGVKNIQKAVELAPTYVEAWYDLAQANYALYREDPQKQAGLKRLLDGLGAYKRVKELKLEGRPLPPEAEKHLDAMFEPIVRQLRE